MTRALIVLIIILFASCSSDDEWTVKSPDGNLKVVLSLDTTNTIQYAVLLDREMVIESSKLGISLSGKGYSFLRDLKYGGLAIKEIQDDFVAISGKRKINSYHANEMVVTFRNSPGSRMDLIFRVSNHEVAYRYQLYNQKADMVDREISEFTLPENSLAWIQQFKGAWNDHEMFYTKRMLDTMGCPAYYMPGLFQTPDGYWIFISDADVTGDYAACQLEHKGKGRLAVRFPDQKYDVPEGLEGSWYSLVHEETADIHAAPILKTPWRAMILSSNLGDIVESNILEHLSTPSRIADESWIEPGVAVFPWWGNSTANDNPEILKDYVDLAAEMNWDFIEFDIGLIGNNGGYAANFWRKIDYIPEVINYAKSKGIKVYGWDERRFLDTPEKRDDIFSTYRDWGVAGIKMDFINSDKQEAMKWYEEATEHAAEYKLLVSYHGAITPRGARRTFPNIMTYEGVRGAEYYKFWWDSGVPTPEHNCTLPFTRNVSGPMDYTPTSFSTPRRTSTYAHELSLPFVFESGWICMADKPEEFRSCPAKELLQNLHAAWDDIHFIDGYPGEYCCLARRKGDQWFIAAINAGAVRQLEMDLQFLGESGFSATIYNDDGQDGIQISEMTLTGIDPLKIDLAENGGFVVHLIPQSQ